MAARPGSTRLHSSTTRRLAMPCRTQRRPICNAGRRVLHPATATLRRSGPARPRPRRTRHTTARRHRPTAVRRGPSGAWARRKAGRGRPRRFRERKCRRQHTGILRNTRAPRRGAAAGWGQGASLAGTGRSARPRRSSRPPGTANGGRRAGTPTRLPRSSRQRRRCARGVRGSAALLAPCRPRPGRCRRLRRWRRRPWRAGHRRRRQCLQLPAGAACQQRW